MLEESGLLSQSPQSGQLVVNEIERIKKEAIEEYVSQSPQSGQLVVNL